MFTNLLATGRFCLVERNDVFNVVGVSQDSPQLHGNLGRQRHEIGGKVTNLRLVKRISEDTGGVQLLDHRGMVIDAPLCGALDLSVVQ